MIFAIINITLYFWELFQQELLCIYENECIQLFNNHVLVELL